jgi:DNA-binding LacI/PurR family transcriptional regulator
MINSPLRRLSVVDQAADHLRDGIRAGRWKSHLPGMVKLADELGVARNTTVKAVARLISEGVILPAEGRNPHAIATVTPDRSGPRQLRVGLLLMSTLENHPTAHQREILRIMADLKSAGHECIPVHFPSGKTTQKTGYLPRLVRDTGADAWLIYTGARNILEWFSSGKGGPALAIGGRCRDLPIAAAVGYDAAAIVRVITHRLLDLGHRRIVLITNLDARHPKPSRTVLAFREELETAGVRPGEFNTPEWEETAEGFLRLLNSLFRVTPPTAVICNNLHTTCGTAAFLTRQGLSVPGDVSVVCFSSGDTLPAWVFPGSDFAHVEDDVAPLFRHIREWVTQVAENRADNRQVWCTANFVEGNTIGPAKPSHARG